MTFKELINTIDYHKVLVNLEKYYNLKENAYKIYQNVLIELKTLKPKSDNPPITLVVAKVEDCLEVGEFIFDVFGIIRSDKNNYSLEMSSWDEWLGFNVLNKSIEFYGIADVVAHSLYEMTFFGYTSKIVGERIEEEKNILEERVRDIEEGTSQLISYEKVMAELGIINDRTPEEKEKDYKEYERISVRNKKIYKILLEGWTDI